MKHKERFGYVLATKMLVEQKLPVRFMYRETASGQDSGWRFFSGLEDQTYVDSAENIAIYDINTILNIDPSVYHYLDSAAGCAFERNSDYGPFQIVQDYGFCPEEDQ